MRRGSAVNGHRQLLQHEKLASADRLVKNPVGTRRACLAGDPLSLGGEGAGMESPAA